MWTLDDREKRTIKEETRKRKRKREGEKER